MKLFPSEATFCFSSVPNFEEAGAECWFWRPRKMQIGTLEITSQNLNFLADTTKHTRARSRCNIGCIYIVCICVCVCVLVYARIQIYPEFTLEGCWLNSAKFIAWKIRIFYIRILVEIFYVLLYIVFIVCPLRLKCSVRSWAFIAELFRFAQTDNWSLLRVFGLSGDNLFDFR